MSQTPSADRAAAQPQPSDDGLPPKPAKPLGPVAWLFGRQLMASMKWILIYTAFGSKLDPRDWMQAKPFPSAKEDEALKEWRARVIARQKTPPGGAPPPAEDPAHAAALRAQEETPDDKAYWARKGEFWFDYIADTGDGQTATYSVAYLCLSNLYVKELFDERPLLKDASVVPECRHVFEKGHQVMLPRGEFLLVGGDTSYHMSDFESLHNRFQLPFAWAYDDLKADLEKAKKEFDAKRRPIFGIPANHDYYDMLDGFCRQFRRPLRSEDKKYGTNDKTAPQLQIRGFERLQDASYIALRLPFGWWLWGLDTEVGQVDERQWDFFRGLCKDTEDPTGERVVLPDKLIVVTCAPTTVFGRFADEDDEKSARAFHQLGLPRPFLPEDKLEPEERQLVMIEPGGNHSVRLRPEQIRLDLSGDIHHYARYWGPKKGDGDDLPLPRTGRRRVPITPPHMNNYASVVAGLGGAFHHPTTTYKNEVREQVLYPREHQSRPAIARQIFNPWRVARGGYVWLYGLVLAFVIHFAATPGLVPSSAQMINNFLPLTAARVTRPERIDPTIQLLDAAGRPAGAQPDAPGENNRPRYFLGLDSAPWEFRYMVGWGLVILSLPLIFLTFVVSLWRHKALKKQERKLREAKIFINKLIRVVFPMVLLNTAVSAVGAAILANYYEDRLTPFESSALVLFSFVWAATSLALSSIYSDWLFEHATNDEVRHWHWAVTWVLSVLAVLSPTAGLWIFGGHNAPAYMFTDIVFIIIVFSTAALLILLASQVGGAMLGWPGKTLMLFVGAWHALLQLAVPFLLVRKGPWQAYFLALAALLFFMWFGRWLMTKSHWGALAIFWGVYGALMLLLPFAAWWLFKGGVVSGTHFAEWGTMLDAFRDYQGFWMPGGELAQASPQYRWLWGPEQLGNWAGLIPAVVAGLIGALLSCVWFGWYLAVCLGFNGHNNEAGGAAMIEGFKGFIRFRVTPEDITGYVIAVDESKFEGRKLRPKLVDVFRLRRETGGATGGSPGPK